MSDDLPKTELFEACAAVLLDEASCSTNIYKYIKDIARQGVASEEWTLWIIQWVAESSTPAIKRARTQAAINLLRVTKRTFEYRLARHLSGEFVSRSSQGKRPTTNPKNDRRFM